LLEQITNLWSNRRADIDRFAAISIQQLEQMVATNTRPSKLVLGPEIMRHAASR